MPVSFGQKIISPVADARGGNNCNRDRAVMDFPDPLSPTMAVSLPFSIEKLRPLTTVCFIPLFEKVTWRFFMVKSGGKMDRPG